jgi:hypothetical protein
VVQVTKYQKDLAERVARTFVQAALAIVATDLAGVTSVDALKGLAIAGIAAGLSAVTNLLGSRVGNPDSGSWER